MVGSGRNSNSFKLSCMPFFPARMERFQSKMNALEWSQQFSHCKSIVIFNLSRAANSAVHDRIKPNLELTQDFIVVLLTCKNEEDPIKM